MFELEAYPPKPDAAILEARDGFCCGCDCVGVGGDLVYETEEGYGGINGGGGGVE